MRPHRFQKPVRSGVNAARDFMNENRYLKK